MAILAATNTENNRTGSGRYTPLKRNKKRHEEEQENQYNKDILEQQDKRMRFKNSKDPVYVAFEYLDKQPLKKLAMDFVKDSINDIFVFVSKLN